MKQEKIPLSSSFLWKQALNGIPHAFGHTWENCFAMKLTTGYNTFLYVLEDDEIRVICPIAERQYSGSKDIVTPYGFSGFVGNHDYLDFQGHWKSFMLDQDYVCAYIGLHPMYENKTYFDLEEVYTNNSLYIIDLRLNISEIFGRLSRNRKRQLRDYDCIKGNFTFDKARIKEFFLDYYPFFFTKKKASEVNYFSRESLSFLLDLENVITVAVCRNNKIEAVTAFAYTPYGAEALFNISLPEGKDHNVPLFWYGINYFKSLKIPYLNLGGGVIEGDSIAQSKIRFGAQQCKLKSIKQIYIPDDYNRFCKNANKNAHDLNGYFPAYRQL